MAPEAIICYQRTLQGRPDYSIAYGQFSFSEQNYIMSLLCHISQLSNECTGNIASMYYEQGQLDQAILHYKQAIACDTGFIEAYNNLVTLTAPNINCS